MNLLETIIEITDYDFHYLEDTELSSKFPNKEFIIYLSSTDDEVINKLKELNIEFEINSDYEELFIVL